MYGFASPLVLPLAVDPGAWGASPDERLIARLQDGRRNLLYVGRYAPNKCQHDLIEAFSHYLRIDPESRLILVGDGAMRAEVRPVSLVAPSEGTVKCAIGSGRNSLLR